MGLLNVKDILSGGTKRRRVQDYCGWWKPFFDSQSISNVNRRVDILSMTINIWVFDSIIRESQCAYLHPLPKHISDTDTGHLTHQPPTLFSP